MHHDVIDVVDLPHATLAWRLTVRSEIQPSF
jgi:hypothetical protein